jgi:hypothetical protein
MERAPRHETSAVIKIWLGASTGTEGCQREEGTLGGEGERRGKGGEQRRGRGVRGWV